jgi:putative DNA primase/helicase
MTDTAPNLSEEAIALAFAERHADELRFVAKLGMWFVWDGMCWRHDETRKVFTLARALCRGVANEVNKPSERKRIASAKTRAAVVVLAGEDYRLVATVDQWDTDPWMLNTPGGVINLRTGKLRRHRLDDYMTKIAAVSPGGECPTWMKFLQRITGGDIDLQRYLQRVAGYCLTGVTKEQELFFFYGSGNNGKGVFTLTLSGILADYHKAASIETFTISKTDRHPTELAGLVGARLVTSSETEEGRRWSEARIKELTGDDKIEARFMRQDFFEFYPQFKLMFSGNHMPALRTVNKAITRRFNRVPFTVTIADTEVNTNLATELKAEWPGVLQWAIEGCLAWQGLGLAPPKAVLEATEEYLESQDLIGEWIADCCECASKHWESTTILFESWKIWAEARDEFVGSARWLSQKLEDSGRFKRKRRGSDDVRGFVGLKARLFSLGSANLTIQRTSGD